MSKTIKSLRDVYEVASRLFPCKVKRIDEVHSKGYMGVNLVIGFKPNPIFRADADPSKPGLSPEERRILLQESNPRIPDVRNIWIRPGTTQDELIKSHLQGIQVSLKNRIVPSKDRIKHDDPKDEEAENVKMAEDLEKGVGAGVGEDSWNDGDSEIDGDEDSAEDSENSEEDEEFGNDEDIPVDDGVSHNSKKESGEPTNRDIMNLLTVLGGNVETLAEDVNTLNERQGQFEGRLNQVDGGDKKATGKKVGKKK